MSTYPKLKSDPEFLKIKTKADEIEHLKHETEKHDYENVLKSLKNDNEEYYKKNYKKKEKKITEILIGSASTLGSSKLAK